MAVYMDRVGKHLSGFRTYEYHLTSDASMHRGRSRKGKSISQTPNGRATRQDRIEHDPSALLPTQRLSMQTENCLAVDIQRGHRLRLSKQSIYE